MINIIESAAVLVVFFLAIFIGSRRADSKLYSAMSLDNTIPIRGMLALIVFLHHVSSFYYNISFISPFTHFGYLAVSLFFFYSGYGLCWGLINKKNYLRRFLINRIIKIYIPYLLCVAIYVIVKFSIFHFVPTFSDIFFSLICCGNIVSVGWYIGELIILYIIFYLSCLFKGRNRIVVFSILFLGLLILLLITPEANLWTKSVIGFPLGLLFCIKRNTIDNILQKRFILNVIFILACFFFGITVKIVGEYFGLLLIKICGSTISSIFFILFLYCLILKIQLGNRFLSFIGKISLEFYLYHSLIIALCLKIDLLYSHCFVFCLSTFVFTLVLSFVLHIFNNRMTKLLLKLFT